MSTMDAAQVIALHRKAVAEGLTEAATFVRDALRVFAERAYPAVADADGAY